MTPTSGGGTRVFAVERVEDPQAVAGPGWVRWAVPCSVAVAAIRCNAATWRPSAERPEALSRIQVRGRLPT